jgi:hypothetical protein
MPTWEQVEQQREARDQQAARERQRVVAAEQQRQQQKRYAERLRSRLFEIMWADINAIPAEQQHVTNLIRQNKPEQINNPDVYRIMLMEIRALTNFGR